MRGLHYDRWSVGRVSAANNDSARGVGAGMVVGRRVRNRIVVSGCVRNYVIVVAMTDVIIVSRGVRHVINMR